MLWWTLRQLKSADAAKRLEAARRLGRSADARASEHLLSLLADASTEVRAAAAGSLGCLGEKRAMEPLLKLLDSDPAWPVRQNAITALASLGDPQVAKAIVPYVEHGIAEVREAAVEALVKLDPPDVKVKQLLSEHRRREAARKLSEAAKAGALANQLTLEEALVFVERRLDPLTPSHHVAIMEFLRNVRRELQPARGQRINVQPGDEILVATLSMLILSLVFHGEFKGIIIADSSRSALDFFKKPVLQKRSADALAQRCGKTLVNANQLVESSDLDALEQVLGDFDSILVMDGAAWRDICSQRHQKKSVREALQRITDLVKVSPTVLQVYERSNVLPPLAEVV